MLKMSLAERKNVAFDILIKISDVCEKNSIPYFLAYGTLLGAVRHNGFIPWDDDIDIWIPQDYYAEAMRCFKQDKDLDVKDHSCDLEWPNAFSKICNPNTRIIERSIRKDQISRGVAVDVFVLANAPASRRWPVRIKVYTRMILWMYKYRHKSFLKEQRLKNLVIKSSCRISLLLGLDDMFWKRKLIKCESGIKDKGYIGCPDAVYKNRDIYPKEWFQEGVMVRFENNQFRVPGGYDKILTQLYGNYMELPPENERCSHHDSDAYWVNK